LFSKLNGVLLVWRGAVAAGVSNPKISIIALLFVVGVLAVPTTALFCLTYSTFSYFFSPGFDNLLAIF
jgi:hypothetical protein